MPYTKLEKDEPVEVLMNLMHGENAIWRSGYTFIKYDTDRHKGTVLVHNPHAIHETTRWKVDCVRRATPKPKLASIIACPMCHGNDCEHCSYLGGRCALCNQAACLKQHECCIHMCELIK